MESWATLASQLLVRTALAAIPLALVVAALCRWMPARPATRHTLWLVLLGWFLVSPMLPGVPLWSTLAAKLAESDASVAQSNSDRSAVEIAESMQLSDAPVDALVLAEPTESADDIEIAEPGKPRFGFLSGRVASTIRSAIESLNVLSQLASAAQPREDLSTDSASQADAPRQADSVTPESIHPPTAPADALNSSRWTEWSAWLTDVRQAITHFPALPPAIIFGGVILLAGVHGLRSLLFRRRLRQTIPTPPRVTALVERCAKRIGLSRAPIVQMTADNLSPMIWCGRRARLILPAPLWSQLDQVGREAIVCHELAHLRRRDHWWCWGDLLAGTLYWWHPLVWWVRRRLHEEAELSCDAWVIWLLPNGRRAYAEALLRTNEIVGHNQRIGPAVGMAVEGGRTRKFARRITMVMTQSTRPRMSLAGLAMAALIAAAGWAAVPARSCPPESGEGESQPVAVEISDGVEISDAVDVVEVSDGKVSLLGVPTGALSVGVISTATACPDEEQTPKAKGGRTGASNSIGGMRKLGITGGPEGVVVVEPRTGRRTTVRPGPGGANWAPAHDRVADLERRVSELARQIEELNARMGHSPRMSLPRTPQPPMPPDAPSPAMRPNAPRAPQPPMPPMPPNAPRARMDRPTPSRSRNAPSNDAIVTRSYKLPKGKLDAMWELMSRSDVPTTVRSIKGGIEVMATPAQHEVFEAFVRLINPEGSSKPRADATGRALEEKIRAEAETQARSTMLRERVRATQERSRAATRERRALQEAREKNVEQLLQQAERLREQADSVREKAAEEAENEAGKAKSRSMLEGAKGIELQAKALEQQMKAMEREASQLEKLGDALESETDALACLDDAFTSLQPQHLAELLTLASKLERDSELKTLAASMGDLSDTLEHDLAAKIEKALESVDFGDIAKLTRHAKSLEKLCETLRTKAGEIEARAEEAAEKAVEADAEKAGR